MEKYHAKCQILKSTIKAQEEGINKIRGTLSSKMKITQGQRSLASLRSGFCLRANSQNIKDIVQLPFISNRDISVKDKTTDINEINDFLKQLYNNFSKLPQFFSKIKESSLLENYQFLPANVKPRECLASSA